MWINSNMLFALTVFCVIFASVFSKNETESISGQNSSDRSRRWSNDEEPKLSVQLGYYLPQDSTHYSMNSEDDHNSDGKYNLPTSFDDFKPDNTQTNKNSYKYSKGGSYNPDTNSWKGEYEMPSSWSPDMNEMMHALQYMHDKPTGLLDKLTSKPVLLLAAVVPLTILLAGVLPSLLGFFLNFNNMMTPTVSTTATGNDGKIQRKDDLSLVEIAMNAIEKLSSENSIEDVCLKKVLCYALKSSEGEFKSIQRGIYKTINFVDDNWIKSSEIKEFVDSVDKGNCERIHCTNSKKQVT